MPSRSGHYNACFAACTVACSATCTKSEMWQRMVQAETKERSRKFPTLKKQKFRGQGACKIMAANSYIGHNGQW